MGSVMQEGRRGPACWSSLILMATPPRILGSKDSGIMSNFRI